MSNEMIKTAVREKYGEIAAQGGSCCGGGSCADVDGVSQSIGYEEADLQSVPEGSNLGLGCGNPTALASIQQGETVLDLGSGAGFDSFIAAKQVGEAGRVIGVDMTPEMITRARENAAKSGTTNVDFRLGEIEHLPVESDSVDLILSNCVINLSTDKAKVFSEAYRVLKPGGRVSISDIVVKKAIPDAIRESIEAYVGCVAGASLKDDYLQQMRDAGFADLKVVEETSVSCTGMLDTPLAEEVSSQLSLSKEQLREAADDVVSVKIQAVKTMG